MKYTRCPLFTSCEIQNCQTVPEYCDLSANAYYDITQMAFGQVYHISIPNHGYVEVLCVHNENGKPFELDRPIADKCFFTRFGWFYPSAVTHTLVSDYNDAIVRSLPYTGYLSGPSPFQPSANTLRRRDNLTDNLFEQ